MHNVGRLLLNEYDDSIQQQHFTFKVEQLIAVNRNGNSLVRYVLSAKRPK